MNLSQIKKYVSSLELKQSLTLNGCEHYNCVKTSLESFIRYMSNHKGNKAFMPYYKKSMKIIKQLNYERNNI